MHPQEIPSNGYFSNPEQESSMEINASVCVMKDQVKNKTRYDNDIHVLVNALSIQNEFVHDYPSVNLHMHTLYI